MKKKKGKQKGDKMAEYGFDLTGFGDSSKRFKKVLKENKLPLKGKRLCKKFNKDLESCSFQWKSKDVKLVTKNNPITGDYGDEHLRKAEVGYASYIGIEGKPKAVEKLAKSIKKHATAIKGENPKEREFI